MAHINGKLLVVKWNNTQIDALVTNSLNVESNMIDTTDKDSGGYKEYIYGDSKWSIDFEGNFDQAGTNNAVDLLDAQLAKTSVTVYFGGESSGDPYWSGTGLLANVNISAPNDDKTTFTGTIQGSGTLTKATV